MDLLHRDPSLPERSATVIQAGRLTEPGWHSQVVAARRRAKPHSASSPLAAAAKFEQSPRCPMVSGLSNGHRVGNGLPSPRALKTSDTPKTTHRGCRRAKLRHFLRASMVKTLFSTDQSTYTWCRVMAPSHRATSRLVRTNTRRRHGYPIRPASSPTQHCTKVGTSTLPLTCTW